MAALDESLPVFRPWEPVAATDHALERWNERARPRDDLRDAWIRGETITDWREGKTDEIRYDAWTQTVLIRVSSRITTIYSIRDEDITNEHGEAAREAVREQVWRSGGDDE